MADTSERQALYRIGGAAALVGAGSGSLRPSFVPFDRCRCVFDGHIVASIDPSAIARSPSSGAFGLFIWPAFFEADPLGGGHPL
jgi:hypothetical protein